MRIRSYRPGRGEFLLALSLPLVLGSRVAMAQQQETQAQRQQVQPGNNAPVWREVRKEGQEHYTSIKGRETGVLIQSLGETWRELRNGWIVPIAGWFFVAFACVLGLYYLTRGPWKLRAKPTGRLIERFTLVRARGALDHGDQLLHPRRERPHHDGGQVRAPAGDRLHAVRLAGGLGEVSAQLRRAGLRREHRGLHRAFRERSDAARGRSHLAHQGGRMADWRGHPVPQDECRAENVVLGRRGRDVEHPRGHRPRSWTFRISTRPGPP